MRAVNCEIPQCIFIIVSNGENELAVETTGKFSEFFQILQQEPNIPAQTDFLLDVYVLQGA